MSADDLIAQVFVGNSEMARLMRERDWTTTAFGPVEHWPQSLRTAVSICLASQFPMILWWGATLSVLYNDAYIPIFQQKHPWVLGRTGTEAWGEVWDVIGPMLERVLYRGEATWSDDELLELHRRGFREETYFTWSYSPIRDESGGIGGVFTAVMETTERVLGARRLLTLRELSEHAFQAMAVGAACDAATATLAKNPADLPFALVYLLDANREKARLASRAGAVSDVVAIPELSLWGDDDVWGVGSTLESRAAKTSEMPAAFGSVIGERWPEPIRKLRVLPLAGGSRNELVGALVVGVSPRLQLDDGYRAFLDLVARHIASAIATASAYQEERRRAEQLAELDRAKTVFFSNVSHEFRTPLTLMLGPTEDALRAPDGALRGSELAMVHRNELRLLRLVNTLLDFSRIEAGRIHAHYEPTNIGAVTTDLVSAFRSAAERAGLTLTVDVDPSVGDGVWVDRDMWEKIVLNLLSNAFKHTFEGGIAVRVSRTEAGVEMTVRDTGVGIPPEHLPHIFERFHRVPAARARTHEGTGIGLSLVQELVRLHGGHIAVESVVDVGTTFRITLPFGHTHLPTDRVNRGATLARTSIGTSAYVEEALRWLPNAVDWSTHSVTGLDAAPGQPHATGGSVLVVDDNADMREYVARLLQPEFDLDTAVDGQDALDRLRQRTFDAVVTDVMMPRIDGFGLLQEIRRTPEMASTRVVLLSARAGEESRIEGLEAGADDYIVKPFSARELVATVRANVSLAMQRREYERREREIQERTTQAVMLARDAAQNANRLKDQFLATLSHELRTPLNAILGYARMLRTDTIAPEKRTRAIEVIERNAAAQHQLVEDLLDMSRITTGKIRIDVEPLPIVQPLQEAIESLRPAVEAKGLELRLDIDPFAGMVVGDATRLQQVFWNLLSNAVKFTPEGGCIDVRLEPLNGLVRITVRDTGIGITGEFLPYVFDAFRQADARFSREHGGLGLGLAICKQLIELHGGAISVESGGRGRGSQFTVTIPTRTAATADYAQRFSSVESRTDGVAKPLAGVDVLVVDDEEDAMELLRDLLEEVGAAVASARHGEDALQIAQQRTPTVLVTDLGMPDMDGFELLEKMRTSVAGCGRRLAAVAVTAYARSEDGARCLSAGFDTYVTKPIDVERLVDAIRQALAATSAGSDPARNGTLRYRRHPGDGTL